MSEYRLGHEWRNQSLSHATMRPEDLIPAFSAMLPASDSLRIEAEALDLHNADPEALDDIVERLFDALDAIAPEGTSFGAHPGDGSELRFLGSRGRS
jgi:hypothetical protein